MNEPVEKLLKQMSLVKPPDALDRAVVESMHQPNPQVKLAPHRRGPSWSVTVFAAISCALAGLLLGIVVAGDRSPNADAGGGAGTDSIALTDISSLTQFDMSGGAVYLRDEGLFLLNGSQPVKKYHATTLRQVKLTDADTGQKRTYEIPISQVVITPSPGT